MLDAGVLINQICRAALPSPLASTLVGAVTIERHGDEALKTSLLPQLDSGLTISAALLEASDSLYGPVTAEYAGGVVTGEKRFVEFGETSAVHLVAAMNGSAPGLAVVRRDQAGVTARDTRTIGALPQATVNYDGAAAEAWIEGEDAIETLRRLGSAVAAFESYAYAQKALDLTVDYVQMRVHWSDLHTLLDRVGPGEWTTYGDLAEAIDSSARAVGGHITACDDCSSAHRVLTTDGEVAGGFHWSDPADTRDPADLLREEGIAFADGRADPASRLDARALAKRSG